MAKNRSDVRGWHKWTLPGVECPQCKNTWGAIGLAYPAINTPELKLTAKRGSWPVPLHEFLKLKEQLTRKLPNHIVIEPATKFGPMVGTVWGKTGDFAWKHTWHLFVRKETLEKLRDAGVKMPTSVPPEVRYARKEKVELEELQLEPFAKFPVSRIKSGRWEVCSACGFCGIKGRGRRKVAPAILKSSIPAHVDLFRILEWDTQIVAKENFVEEVKRMNATNLLFTEIEVIE